MITRVSATCLLGLTFLGLLVLPSLRAQADIGWTGYANCDDFYPHDGTYSFEGPGPFNTPCYSVDQSVSIVGPGQFDVVWHLQIKLDNVVQDYDDGGGRVTTDEDNLWIHKAHGTGQLYGEAL